MQNSSIGNDFEFANESVIHYQDCNHHEILSSSLDETLLINCLRYLFIKSHSFVIRHNHHPNKENKETE